MSQRGVSGRMNKLSRVSTSPGRVDGLDCEPNYEDNGPCKLDSDRNAVGSTVIPALRRVVHDGRKEETDSDRQLVRSYDCTSNPLRRSLRLVHRNCARLARILQVYTSLDQVELDQIACESYPRAESD